MNQDFQQPHNADQPNNQTTPPPYYQQPNFSGQPNEQAPPNSGAQQPHPGGQPGGQQQPNPGAQYPHPGGQPGGQEQANQSYQQPNAEKPSIADELKQCWEDYQKAKKISEEFGENQELRKAVEDVAYQQFKENIRKALAGNIGMSWSRSKSQKSTSSAFDWMPRKKLYRSSKDKMLAGVCGGVAEYFEFDVTLFRIVYAILTLVTIPVGGFGFISILAYMILAILLPVAPVQAE